jgi:NAD(P)-dependent dehydrogenase (short-subunit alcohol dehydrogenase family)
MQTPRVYWLTGASSGIGRELARGLATAGHRVYVSARNTDALATLVADYPGQLVALPCDVSDDLAMQSVFNSLPEAQRPQQIDGLILSAGTCEYVDLPELDMASFRRVADVNFFGVVNACKVALPLLQAAAQKSAGRKPEIVGICSMSVLTGFPRAEAYGATKAAMGYFLNALRCDVQATIDVTVVYPGFVTTPMTATNDFPMPFCISATEAASHILARLGRGKRSISFPWQLDLLLRLASLLPGLWYGVLMKKISRQHKKSGSTPQGRPAP